MSRAIALAALMIVAGYLALRLSEEIPPLKLVAYIIFFTLALDLAIALIIPMLLIAFRLDERRLRRWEASKPMLLTLAVQSIAAYASLVAQVFAIRGEIAVAGLTLTAEQQLTALLIINTYLAARLAAECMDYMRLERGFGAAVLMLGMASYLIYLVELARRFGWL